MAARDYAGELMTFSQLAVYLAYEGQHARGAARKFVERNGLRRLWRGRTWLVRRADVDAVLEGRRVA